MKPPPWAGCSLGLASLGPEGALLASGREPKACGKPISGTKGRQVCIWVPVESVRAAPRIFGKRVPGAPAQPQGGPGTSATATTYGAASTAWPLWFPPRLQPALLCTGAARCCSLKGLALAFIGPWLQPHALVLSKPPKQPCGSGIRSGGGGVFLCPWLHPFPGVGGTAPASA